MTEPTGHLENLVQLGVIEMREEWKTTHRSHQDLVGTRKGYPIRDPIEKGTTTTIVKTDRMIITTKKEQVEREEEGI